MCNCEETTHPGIACSSERCNCHRPESEDKTKFVVALTFNAEQVEAITDIVSNLNLMQFPEFEGPVRVAVDPLATSLEEWLEEDLQPSSNLVQHAKRELELIGEEEETIAGYLRIVRAFADMGHSGGSASVAIPTISQLLQYKPLAPLTDNPDDWFFHEPETWGGEEGEGVWQCKRNSEAFSYDGGKHYYLLSEGGNAANREPLHESISHEEFLKSKDAEVSPYCSRCVKAVHGNYPHHFHETNEHDDWWSHYKTSDD